MKLGALCPQAGETAGEKADDRAAVASAAETRIPKEKGGNRSVMPYNLFFRHGAASAIGTQ